LWGQKNWKGGVKYINKLKRGGKGYTNSRKKNRPEDEDKKRTGWEENRKRCLQTKRRLVKKRPKGAWFSRASGEVTRHARERVFRSTEMRVVTVKGGK